MLARTFERLIEAVAPGVKTRELDRLARREIGSHGATPSFLGYRGYPAAICVSINEEVVHGIPGDRAIEDGDIVSMDLGAVVDGFHADAATSVIAGSATAERTALLEAARTALTEGIAAARPGNRIGDVSAAIERAVESAGFSVVREYVGHGIGRNLHEPPQVPNYGPPGQGPLLKAGMTLAIEPMVNMGGWRTRALDDGWTVVTADGMPSAHFEHTVAITDEGPVILTEP
ncbi:MAG: type I methionyl aminopeptidase [Gemmatimonadetes bacterium]|nr:type I methionyl aminopeptidase [Gemmatimonadota bacterium]